MWALPSPASRTPYHVGTCASQRLAEALVDSLGTGWALSFSGEDGMADLSKAQCTFYFQLCRMVFAVDSWDCGPSLALARRRYTIQLGVCAEGHLCVGGRSP